MTRDEFFAHFEDLFDAQDIITDRQNSLALQRHLDLSHEAVCYLRAEIFAAQARRHSARNAIIAAFNKMQRHRGYMIMTLKKLLVLCDGLEAEARDSAHEADIKGTIAGARALLALLEEAGEQEPA